LKLESLNLFVPLPARNQTRLPLTSTLIDSAEDKTETIQWQGRKLLDSPWDSAIFQHLVTW